MANLSPDRSPKSIAVATTTFYPGWYDQVSNRNISSDQVRGDLAIQLISSVKKLGYSLVVVDGTSSQSPFRRKLLDLGINVESEKERGMSKSRQQAFKSASSISGTEAIAWVEPEKASFITNGLAIAASPILDGNADIIVPGRSEQGLATYPDYQSKSEKKSNLIWNALLRKYGYRNNLADLDVWFGPRVFKNSPDVLEIFLRSYVYTSSKPKGQETIDPGLWSNALFLPVVNAICDGLRVDGVTIDYSHSPAQTALELNSVSFQRKRQLQRNVICLLTEEILRLRSVNPRKPSRLSLES